MDDVLCVNRYCRISLCNTEGYRVQMSCEHPDQSQFRWVSVGDSINKDIQN